jgi:hypothetical protein
MLTNSQKIKSLLFAIITLTMIILSGSVSAKACKGMSQSACSKSTVCTWVKGYKTKTGNKVASYCRNKASKKSTSAKTQKKTNPVKANKSATKKTSTNKSKKSSAKKTSTSKAKKSSTKKTSTKKADKNKSTNKKKKTGAKKSTKKDKKK